MATITEKQVLELKASGHIVFAMPRKGMIRVDGFKLFLAGPAAIKAAK